MVSAEKTLGPCEACKQRGVDKQAAAVVRISHDIYNPENGTVTVFALCEDHYYRLMKFIDKL